MRHELHRGGGWLAGLMVVGALGGCSGEGTEVANAPPELKGTGPDAVNGDVARAGARTMASEYHDEWRELFEDHITWTRMVILGVFDDLAGNDVYTARLIQNYFDMEDALEPYYDEAEVEELGELLEEHLLIAAEILVAAKAGDDARLGELVATWRKNGDEIATQMAEMNPSWPLYEGMAMWREHLDVTLEEAVTHLTGDFEGEVAAWEKVHAGGLMMADFFSDGVIEQFPGRFSGCR